MPTVEQYLNIPDTFEIEINQKIRVKVESLAPAWLTMLLKRLAEYRNKKNEPFLKEVIEKAKDGERFTLDLAELMQDRKIGLDSTEIEDEELEIIQMMTVPNHKWKEHKGDFAEHNFGFTLQDMKESFTELQLMKIWQAFWQRNPRLDRKKNMMNPGQA